MDTPENLRVRAIGEGLKALIEANGVNDMEGPVSIEATMGKVRVFMLATQFDKCFGPDDDSTIRPGHTPTYIIQEVVEDGVTYACHRVAKFTVEEIE